MALSGAERAQHCGEKKIATGLSEAIKEKNHQRKQKCFEHVVTHLKALILSFEQLGIFSDESTTLVNYLVSKVLGTDS